MPDPSSTAVESLLEWANTERLRSPYGYFFAGFNGADFACGTDEEAVLQELLASTEPGQPLVLSCAPATCESWLGPELRRLGVSQVLLGTAHPSRKSGVVESLRGEGIACDFSSLFAEFWQLNEAHAFSKEVGRPLIVAKMATSIDGRIATRTGESQWITGHVARAAGHILRRRSGAIVVGRNTVEADDPSLNARLEPEGPNPLRVIVATRPELPAGCQLLDVSVAPTLLAHAERDSRAEDALRKCGVVTACHPSAEGRVDLHALTTALAKEGVEQILVEGGGELIGSFLEADLIDRVVQYQAPLLIGGNAARPCVGGHGIGELDQARRGWRTTVQMLGSDVELVTDFALELRPPTCE